MITINSEEQAAQITDDELPDVDFSHLLATYQSWEFETGRHSLFVVLMCLIDLKKTARPFSLSWIIENIGSPDYAYFDEDHQQAGDLFYLLSGSDCVGHIRIRQAKFNGFGTVERDHFESVCLPMATWHECVERLRPLSG